MVVVTTSKKTTNPQGDRKTLSFIIASITKPIDTRSRCCCHARCQRSFYRAIPHLNSLNSLNSPSSTTKLNGQPSSLSYPVTWNRLDRKRSLSSSTIRGVTYPKLTHHGLWRLYNNMSQSLTPPLCPPRPTLAHHWHDGNRSIMLRKEHRACEYHHL